MGIYESDSYLTLNPQSTWKCCYSKDQLISKLSAALSVIPGVAYEFTQPMEMRMDEALTGIRGDVAIKIFGDDINSLQDLARHVLAGISRVSGAFNPQMGQTAVSPLLQIDIKRDQPTTYGPNNASARRVLGQIDGCISIADQ